MVPQLVGKVAIVTGAAIVHAFAAEAAAVAALDINETSVLLLASDEGPHYVGATLNVNGRDVMI